MGAMQNPQHRRAPHADLDQYNEKTSEHGHYELASQYKSGKSHFNWVEDNRTFEAPPAETPTETPASDPQELLESYKQGITANNSTEVEKVGSNLNTDLINSMETTDNNQFGSKTFSAVPTADKAAQNFFTDKKQLVLNAFK